MDFVTRSDLIEIEIIAVAIKHFSDNNEVHSNIKCKIKYSYFDLFYRYS